MPRGPVRPVNSHVTLWIEKRRCPAHRQTAGRSEPNVRPRPQRRHSTTSRALDQSALQEEGFVGILNGVGLLTDALRQGGQADGVAFKSITQGHQDGPVDLVQAKLVDPEQVETLARRGSVDRTVTPNFGEVTDPSQKPVGHTGRAPGPFRYPRRPFIIDLRRGGSGLSVPRWPAGRPVHRGRGGRRSRTGHAAAPRPDRCASWLRPR